MPDAKSLDGRGHGFGMLDVHFRAKRRVQLATIRFEHRGTLVCKEVPVFRIHDDRDAPRASELDRSGDDGWHEHALVVVLEHQRVRIPHGVFDGGADGVCIARREIDIVLLIDANQLLRTRDDARLSCRWPIDAQQPPLRNTDVPEHGSQLAARMVVADGGNEAALGADGDDVLCHVRRAAERITSLTNPHHGNGCFRRNPVDISDEILVEHGVTDRDDACATCITQQRCQAVSTEGNRHGREDSDPAHPLPLVGLGSATRDALPNQYDHLSELILRLNARAKSSVLSVQEYFVLAWNSLRFIFARPFYTQDMVQQMDEIGVKSLGIVLLTGLFTGMVLALQSSVQLQTFGATMYIGRLVAGSMIRELGRVLAGLMVAGRVGSGIAAQLGSMKVTEQIDALNTLGTDPIKKLATPRVLAALVMLPVLTIINDMVGIVGGNVIATLMLGLPSSLYWRTVWEQIISGGFVFGFIPNDFVQGLVKPFVFGAIIAITACYFGLRTTGGTEGVGQSTTKTVVTSSILILVTDYFLTQLLLSLLVVP